MSGVNGVSRTVPQLYRDLLRLAHHVGGSSAKGSQLRAIIKGEFLKNRAVEDPAVIDALKANAVRALSNYLVFESMSKDPSQRDKFIKPSIPRRPDSPED